MAWKCNDCGIEHDEVPLCFNAPAPCYWMLPEEEIEDRAVVSADQCIIDDRHFFIRGQLELPVMGHPEPFAFSVWASLSEQSFDHVCERWEAADRGDDPPYFGWLSNVLPLYPDTLNLKLSVQSRAPGTVPLFTLEETDHPLSVDQYRGITVARWHEMASELMRQKR